MRFIEKIKDLLRLTPLYDWFGKRSFAQSGEDLIAWGELSGKVSQCHSVTVPAGPGLRGYYVDVGAYHPKLFSNTYLFYKKGWRGICVEPNLEMASLYRVARPRDVFLNMGVGTGESATVSQCHKSLSASPSLPLTRETEKMEYFMFEDGATNTFSAEQARKNIVEAGRKLKGKTKIKIKTLKSILDKNLPKGQRIDLLSVDVEGMDEEVLRSNDWKKYRPEMIIAEDLGFELEKYRGWIYPFGYQRPDQVGNDSGVRLPFRDGRVTPRPYKRNENIRHRERSVAIQKNPGFPPSGINEPWFEYETRNDGGSGVVKFLNSVGYSLVAKTPYSLIFKINERSRTNKLPI